MYVLGNIVDYLGTPTLLVFTTVFLAGIYVLVLLRGDRVRWPPGPRPLPFIGNGLLLINNRYMYKTFTDLAEKYGEIFHLRVGPKWHAVVLSGHDIIREAFIEKGEYFNNRPNFMKITKYFGDGKGISMQNGPHWSALRKFTLTSMRDFGVGKRTMEEKIQCELNAVISVIDETNGTPFDPHKFFNNAVSNIICQIIFDRRFQYDDAGFQRLLDKFDYILVNGGPSNDGMNWISPSLLMAFVPVMKNIFGAFKDIQMFVREEILNHRETFDEGNIRDFIDIYLKAEKEEDRTGALTDENIFQVIIDLFLAGTETTSMTIRWALLYFILHPDVQTKCREEIGQVIGQSRLPSLKDKGTIPYTEATILEVQRLACVAPTGLSHTVRKPVTLRGYYLPKDTIVHANIYQSHMDQKVWKDPFAFNPDRWLDDANKLKSNPAFMPFCVEGRLAPYRGPSCPIQKAVLPQSEGRLAPYRGPSCPIQRAVLPHTEGHLALYRGPSCPIQRAVLPQGWEKKGAEVSAFADPLCMCEFACLVYITEHLNQLNAQP
ncbi:Cytochrome P450 2J2 [Lamellibrachia satsuma]|nr:Cytochrome P450 2J2 [Lamellibrachia satsuma]